MSSRESILAALPAPVGPDLVRTVVPTLYASSPSADLKAQFESAFVALGGKIGVLGDLDLEGAFVDPEAAPYLGQEVANGDVWEAPVGVTLAHSLIAETGTIVVCAGPNRHRLASLVPPRHVVLASVGSLVSTLDEALRQLPQETTVLISGTSRTADIEGVMVRGVHGPGEVTLVWV